MDENGANDEPPYEFQETPDETGRRMPHAEPIEVGDWEFAAGELVEMLGPRLTEARRARIDEVLAERTYHVATVLDGIYDRGNVSAVIRTAEALGYQSMHVIETQEHFKEANRVTQGTDKWVDIERWETHRPCVEVLRHRGYRLAATDLEASKTLDELDFREPTAVVFGNERDGVSETMLEAADQRFRIPMVGFAQSLNISVSAALVLREIYRRRVETRGRQGDLEESEREMLTALYYLRSIDDPERLVRGLMHRR